MEKNLKSIRNAKIADIIFAVLNNDGRIENLEDAWVNNSNNGEGEDQEVSSVILTGINVSSDDDFWAWDELTDDDVEMIYDAIAEQYPELMERQVYVVCEEYRDHHGEEGTTLLEAYYDAECADVAVQALFADRQNEFFEKFDDVDIESECSYMNCEIQQNDYEDYSIVFAREMKIKPMIDVPHTRYEVYDSNCELEDGFDNLEDALAFYHAHEMQFILDTETNEIVEGVEPND